MDSNLKRQIILDNYNNPSNRERKDNHGYVKENSRNISCIDNIDIYLKIEDSIIKDIAYEGEACAISISSSSIMSNLFKNKTIAEALNIINNYYNMIEEKDYDKDLLKEANVFDETYKQPSRKMCATLMVRGVEKALKKYHS